MSDQERVDITAIKAVTRFLNDRKTRENITNANFGVGVPIIAVGANMTIKEVQYKMSVAASSKIVLGVYFPERSETTTIPAYRQVQIILCEKTRSKNVEGREGFEMFSDISPDASIGMYCDYLWQDSTRTVAIPDFTQVKGFTPKREALVMA